MAPSARAATMAEAMTLTAAPLPLQVTKAAHMFGPVSMSSITVVILALFSNHLYYVPVIGFFKVSLLNSIIMTLLTDFTMTLFILRLDFGIVIVFFRINPMSLFTKARLFIHLGSASVTVIFKIDARTFIIHLHCMRMIVFFKVSPVTVIAMTPPIVIIGSVHVIIFFQINDMTFITAIRLIINLGSADLTIIFTTNAMTSIFYMDFARVTVFFKRAPAALVTATRIIIASVLLKVSTMTVATMILRTVTLYLDIVHMMIMYKAGPTNVAIMGPSISIITDGSAYVMPFTADTMIGVNVAMLVIHLGLMLLTTPLEAGHETVVKVITLINDLADVSIGAVVDTATMKIRLGMAAAGMEKEAPAPADCGAVCLLCFVTDPAHSPHILTIILSGGLGNILFIIFIIIMTRYFMMWKVMPLILHGRCEAQHKS